MKTLFIPISIGLMCTSFTINHNTKQQAATAIAHTAVQGNNSTSVATILYENIQLNNYGLSQEAFTNAWKGYEVLTKNNSISKPGYLTICDFSQSSGCKRFYLIDVVHQKLVKHTYVAHGKNSGREYATCFSNVAESLQSSLGFYTTAETYTGEHGLSLRLKGLDAGFNCKAYARSIVIHGAAYVDAARAKTGAMMGRSFGCPAVPQNESDEIIRLIKNGSCLFIYHPNKNYLENSRILKV